MFRRWIEPVMPLGASVSALREYPRFLSEWRRYARTPGAERLDVKEGYPCLLDRVATTPYDPHYFHQAVWATKRIVAGVPAEHVDVGSDVNFVGTLSAIVPVAFVDIRPLPVELENLRSLTGDLAGGLPFAEQSLRSVSCLHVAEHVGLGRYGDELAVDGTKRACVELARILAAGGNLFFSVPVGRPRVCFNAHRIHSPQQILAYFGVLELIEFSFVGDDYRLQLSADPDDAAQLEYGCGLFWFRRGN